MIFGSFCVFIMILNLQEENKTDTTCRCAQIFFLILCATTTRGFRFFLMRCSHNNNETRANINSLKVCHKSYKMATKKPGLKIFINWGILIYLVLLPTPWTSQRFLSHSALSTFISWLWEYFIHAGIFEEIHHFYQFLLSLVNFHSVSQIWLVDCCIGAVTHTL